MKKRCAPFFFVFFYHFVPLNHESGAQAHFGAVAATLPSVAFWISRPLNGRVEGGAFRRHLGRFAFGQTRPGWLCCTLEETSWDSISRGNGDKIRGKKKKARPGGRVVGGGRVPRKREREREQISSRGKNRGSPEKNALKNIY